MLSRVKLISEPWDIGPGGYQLGHHPPGFAEWNDRYRDGIRRFWRGDAGQRGETRGAHRRIERPVRSPRAPALGLGQLRRPRMTASRSPTSSATSRSTTRPTARTTATATARTTRPTGASRGRPTIRRSTRRARACSARCWRPCSSRTARRCCWPATSSAARSSGNNNAYCQDNEISWLDWKQAETPEAQGARRLRGAADATAPREPGAALPPFPARQGRARARHSRHRLVRYARRNHLERLLEQPGEAPVRPAPCSAQRGRHRSDPHPVSQSERSGSRLPPADAERADAAADRQRRAGRSRRATSSARRSPSRRAAPS